MTFNSKNEIQVFQNRLASQGFNFVELVPNSKDPNWFRNACKSGVQCDVLVVSGHFGGLFFGEKTSPILKLEDIEKASCQRSCDGILRNPKEVFLMGCNTLAGKKADHRTPQDYLRVLVSDGFPADIAERIVTSRYSNEGFSMAQRSMLAFYGAEKIYGFDGTGPLGAVAAPKLDQYLRSVGNYSSHLSGLGHSPNRKLGNAFSGFSIRAQNPKSDLTQELFKTSCDLSKNIVIYCRSKAVFIMWQLT